MIIEVTEQRREMYMARRFVDELGDEAIAQHERHAARLAELAFDDAPVPARRRSRGASRRKTPRSATARRAGPKSSSHSAGGAYVNFLMDEGNARVRAAYRDNHARLAEVKRRYDPENLFRVNQNIRPA